ncbi:Hypothetical predicted protein [Paramuricea clavata]|uniref:Uncharacterized protein n=1 Tax=Paramuricea clavata TaxID=317549 RepID=A0A6S7JU61_PARCT|nr:Hypothetical predicted protein [Paramuricea clavata]
MNTWTKFWWWNSGTTWPTTVKDVLEKVYGTCNTSDYCFQRLPAWTKENKTELLAVDSLGTIYQWKFDTINPTGHAVWLALHDHQETAATKIETITSFENWRQNLIYTLSLDSNFAPFLAEDATWGKKTRAQPLRGFTDDGEAVAQNSRQTAQQKVNFLELMLGQIANYCPIISRNTLVKNSTSIQSIWNTIREHFGFQVTGAHFLDFANLRLETDERPEDLYQRLVAFVEDCLLRANSLSHHGVQLAEDEELSSTVENLIVLTWLRLINPELPKLVKQRYGTELRSRTLASIKPEISQALSSLLEEIHSADDAKIMRTAVSSYRKPGSERLLARPNTRSNRPLKSCPLCKQAGRTNSSHFLSECNFLPDQDRRYMVKARQIAEILEDIPESESSIN